MDLILPSVHLEIMLQVPYHVFWGGYVFSSLCIYVSKIAQFVI